MKIFNTKCINIVSVGVRLFFIISVVFYFCTYAYAQSRFSSDEIKTAYIYNFLQFIQYRKQKEVNSYQIIIYDKNEEINNYSHLKTLSRKTIKGRPIEVIVHNDIDYINRLINQKSFVVLYFPESISQSNLSDVLKQLGKIRPLTLGQSRNFIDSGGIINFLEKKGKIFFEINYNVAKKFDLKIPSKVLRLAVKIHDMR